MEITGSLLGEAGRAVVVRGFVTELAWYEPGTEPSFGVIFTRKNCVYHLAARSEHEAKGIARNLTHTSGVITPGQEPWLVLPIIKDQRWANDPTREDSLYCWNVEAATHKRFKPLGLPDTVPVWTIAYRTLPDHQIMEIAQGVGIVRYVFEHHGTVASAEMVLKSIEFPGR
jgi:hypothetical protein